MRKNIAEEQPEPSRRVVEDEDIAFVTNEEEEGNAPGGTASSASSSSVSSPVDSDISTTVTSSDESEESSTRQSSSTQSPPRGSRPRHRNEHRHRPVRQHHDTDDDGSDVDQDRSYFVSAPTPHDEHNERPTSRNSKTCSSASSDAERAEEDCERERYIAALKHDIEELMKEDRHDGDDGDAAEHRPDHHAAADGRKDDDANDDGVKKGDLASAVGATNRSDGTKTAGNAAHQVDVGSVVAGGGVGGLGGGMSHSTLRALPVDAFLVVLEYVPAEQLLLSVLHVARMFATIIRGGTTATSGGGHHHGSLEARNNMASTFWHDRWRDMIIGDFTRCGGSGVGGRGGGLEITLLPDGGWSLDHPETVDGADLLDEAQWAEKTEFEQANSSPLRTLPIHEASLAVNATKKSKTTIDSRRGKNIVLTAPRHFDAHAVGGAHLPTTAGTAATDVPPPTKDSGRGEGNESKEDEEEEAQAEVTSQEDEQREELLLRSEYNHQVAVSSFNSIAGDVAEEEDAVRAIVYVERHKETHIVMPCFRVFRFVADGDRYSNFRCRIESLRGLFDELRTTGNVCSVVVAKKFASQYLQGLRSGGLDRSRTPIVLPPRDDYFGMALPTHVPLRGVGTVTMATSAEDCQLLRQIAKQLGVPKDVLVKAGQAPDAVLRDARGGCHQPGVADSDVLPLSLRSKLLFSNGEWVVPLYSEEHLCMYRSMLASIVVTDFTHHLFDAYNEGEEPMEEKKAVCARIIGPCATSVELRFFYSLRGGSFPRLYTKTIYCRSTFPDDVMAERFKEDMSMPTTLIHGGYGRVEVDIRPTISKTGFCEVAELLRLPPTFPWPLLYNVVASATCGWTLMRSAVPSFVMYYKSTFAHAFESTFNITGSRSTSQWQESALDAA